MTSAVAVREIDVHSDRALREYVGVIAASARHDRSRPDLRTVGELAARLRRPDPYSSAALLGVRLDGVLVAVAEQWWALQDNTHVADAEIHVVPDRRRQGLGRAMHDVLDRRRRALGRPVSRMEVYAPLDGTSPGLAFAAALGYDDLHLEDHLVLDVEPVAAPTPPPGYRLVTWGPLCPPELVAAFTDLRTRMELDVPLGELDYEPVLWDEARLRTDEAHTALANHSLVAAAVRTGGGNGAGSDDGSLAGYSQLLLPRDGTEAMQEDTLVLPEDRGHGLGGVLKRANLVRLSGRHPEVRVVHTWTDPDNLPMHRTNTRLGFRPVERLHEMERRDAL